MSKRGLILSVFKPAGWTSFDVCAKVRSLLGWKRVGHAGTLDPSAEGVLILLCGEATKRSAEFMNLPKRYRARIRFGITTTTDDLDGEILSVCDIGDWSSRHIRQVLNSFRGEFEQTPPAVSAVKVGGRRSYDLARRGMPADLLPRTVCIYDLRVLAEPKPEIDIEVECSRGTYIRSLARDVGEKLGWGGCLAKLIRSAIGPYELGSGLTIEMIRSRSSEFQGE